MTINSQMPQELIEDVEIEFDDNTKQWLARYTGFHRPIEGSADKREEALAMLVEVVALAE